MSDRKKVVMALVVSFVSLVGPLALAWFFGSDQFYRALAERLGHEKQPMVIQDAQWGQVTLKIEGRVIRTEILYTVVSERPCMESYSSNLWGKMTEYSREGACPMVDTGLQDRLTQILRDINQRHIHLKVYDGT